MPEPCDILPDCQGPVRTAQSRLNQSGLAYECVACLSTIILISVLHLDRYRMNATENLSRRLFGQRVAGTPFEKPEDVVRWLGCVQSQDYTGARWSVGQRVANCTDADVAAAFDAGRILRTHVLRPTWHFVFD